MMSIIRKWLASLEEADRDLKRQGYTVVSGAKQSDCFGAWVFLPLPELLAGKAVLLPGGENSRRADGFERRL